MSVGLSVGLSVGVSKSVSEEGVRSSVFVVRCMTYDAPRSEGVSQLLQHLLLPQQPRPVLVRGGQRFLQDEEAGRLGLEDVLGGGQAVFEKHYRGVLLQVVKTRHSCDKNKICNENERGKSGSAKVALWQVGGR